MLKKLLDSLDLNADQSEKTLVESDNEASRDFRAFQYYINRPEEEDDDWPNFMGEKEVLKKVIEHLGEHYKKEGISVWIEDQEKCWFTVILTKG